MNRRTLLKSATSCAVATWVGQLSKVAAADVVMTSDATPNKAAGMPLTFGDGRDWFSKMRYGMFIHWGLYAIPGWHEQHQQRKATPRNEYIKLAKEWNPHAFDPNQWLDLLQEAGMKYLTITAKHHDGFCLWDTKQTAFNTMNTPYRKDVIGMLSDACHRREIPLCLYYSVVDWNHPNYPNQGRHHELPVQPEDSPDWQKYMEFLNEQVRELCSNYGEIHGFWWDMNVPQHKDLSINTMIRKLQPNAVINDRGFDDGDFGTPERDFDNPLSNGKRLERLTEACQSVGMESWGYRKDEDYYTDRHLIASIDRYLSAGANYLLNVGPTKEGLIPTEAAEILKRIGKWKQSVDEAYLNVKGNVKLPGTRGILCTKRDRTLYIHLNENPQGNSIKLPSIRTLPVQATLLNNGKPVDLSIDLCPSDHRTGKAALRLRNLPVNELANSVLIAKLDFEDSLEQVMDGTTSQPEMEVLR